MRKLIFTLLLLAGCTGEKEKPRAEPSAIPVIASQVEEKDIPLLIDVVGTLHPSAEVQLTAQVQGVLQEVHIQEGEYVAQGDILLAIEPSAYQIKVAEAEAQLSHDRAVLAMAGKRNHRYESLAQKDLIEGVKWDELAAETAKAQAQAAQSQARLAAAKRDLNNCTLRAPMDGRLGRLALDPGNFVPFGTSLASLADISTLEVEFSFTEKEMLKLLENPEWKVQEIEVALVADPSIQTKGRLTFYDNKFQEASGLIQLKGEIVNASHRFLPGQSVRVRVPVGMLSNAKVVPAKAIKMSQAGPYVYVVEADQTAAQRPVRIGSECGGAVVILEGLQPSDRVISDGHLRLYPGAKTEMKP